MSDPTQGASSLSASTETESLPHAEDKLLDHQYDGIQEFDNPLPRWWVWMYTGSIVFSFGYFFHYHISPNGQSDLAAYEADMAVAREAELKSALAQPVSEASLAQLMADEALMNDARKSFELRCAPCHGDNAQGTIGPNLTDSAWLHGQGTLTDIYGVVEAGVVAKGMPAWGKQLTPVELRKLVAYVGSQRGKSLPGKAPEGNVSATP